MAANPILNPVRLKSRNRVGLLAAVLATGAFNGSLESPFAKALGQVAAIVSRFVIAVMGFLFVAMVRYANESLKKQTNETRLLRNSRYEISAGRIENAG